MKNDIIYITGDENQPERNTMTSKTALWRRKVRDADPEEAVEAAGAANTICC